VIVVLPARSLVLRGLLAVLLAATVSTARSADAQKTEDWKLCSSICRAANGKRMVVSSAYSIECWAGGNDGVLRILDRLGVSLIALQECDYGSGMGTSKYPLWISRIGNAWNEKYRLDFHYPRESSSKSFVEVGLKH
ncbi:unnamed protein product, partial [Polarella glacialis]